MIPVTVSFFLESARGNRAGGSLLVRHYCAFLRYGPGRHGRGRPFEVQLGSNPWVNGFIAIVFCAFALSLLGAFEITLPSGLLTKLTRFAQRYGYFGTLLMGFTFALTSFACVGPFVGSLLAASVQTKGIQPTLGMVSFAGGLSAPFFFLAAFPSYLKKLPRSGGWLMRVKVVMGFVPLPRCPHVSNIDQVLQTNSTRERFSSRLAGAVRSAWHYLLGLLRL